MRRLYFLLLAMVPAAFVSPSVALPQEERQAIGQMGSPSVSTITLGGAPYTQEIDGLIQRGVMAAAKIAPDRRVDDRSALLVSDVGKLTIGLSLIPLAPGTVSGPEFVLISSSGRVVHTKTAVDILSRQVHNLVVKEMDGTGVEFNRTENTIYRTGAGAKESSQHAATSGTVGCIKQGIADAFKPCEAALLLNEIRACVVLLANTADTAGVSDLFAVAPCSAAAAAIGQALACAGIDCLINGGSNTPPPAINDINPKIIPLNADTLLTIDGQNFQQGFSARVIVNGQTFPINPGAQTIFVNTNRVLLWVKIGGPPASMQYSVQIVNPDNKASNIYSGLGASTGQQGGNQGNTELQVSFQPSPVGPASADCGRAYYFSVIVRNMGTNPVTISSVDVDTLNNLSLSQVGFPNQIGPSSQFQSGIKYCRGSGSTTWTIHSSTGAVWSGTEQLLQ